MANYSFSFDNGKDEFDSVCLHISLSDGEPWSKAVESFLSFLEVVYGYPIKDGILYLDEMPNILPSRTVTAYLENKDKPDPFTS